MGYANFLINEHNLVKLDKYNYAGKLSNYYSIININSLNNKAFTLKIGATDGDIDVKEAFVGKLDKKISFKTYDAVIEFIIPIKTFKGGTTKYFNENLDLIINILKTNNFKTGCFINGITDEKIELVRRTKAIKHYSYLAISTYKDEIKKLEEVKNKEIETKENVLMGILGTIGVGLISIILYLFIGKILNSYFFIVPFVIYIFGILTYKKLAKKLTIKSYIIVALILFIALFIATFLEFHWRIYEILKEDYLLDFIEAFEFTPYVILEDQEVFWLFIKDILINGGMLLAVAIVGSIIFHKDEAVNEKLELIDPYN